MIGVMLAEVVERLVPRLATEPQFPSQGRTVFVDLSTRRIRSAYTPKHVLTSFLSGRGANMFYLANLLDPTLDPFDPDVPLIFGSGILTGIAPSAARGNVTGVSPETRILMDSNAGDYFPSYMRLQGVDHLIVWGQPAEWTYLYMKDGQIEFRDARPWLGLDNIDLRERVEHEIGGTWAKDLAMASITVAGERRVLSAGIMVGPKALYARGGTGAKMGALGLKAIVTHGYDVKRAKLATNIVDLIPYNKVLAQDILDTGVVKHALSLRGTPFLYKPSRILGAMGTKNNQETTWVDALDAENIDPFRPGMEGCFRCPVNCRPLNAIPEPDHPEKHGDRYEKGDGPEYVTVGKFGPMIGIKDVKQLLRLNNICNDLGMDSASLGSSIAWAMELYQRGIITRQTTGGLDLAWGNYPVVEKLMFMTARREGFGDTIAASARAVDEGFYPEQALDYRMAVKGLMQSDPHDARILKAFALGLAVATRGMDHLRNRATLEINARINDDPAFKKRLYGHDVAAAPQSYVGKEWAVRACEDIFAVGDAIGMCRFTTRLFNSPNLPGMDHFSRQIENVTGWKLTEAELEQVGRNIIGLERLINYDLGNRRKDDTLPKRWFEEPITVGKFQGEKIDPVEFQALLSRFYQISGLDHEGLPRLEWRQRLTETARGFAVAVKLPQEMARAVGADPEGVVVSEPVTDLGQLCDALDDQVPGTANKLDDSVWTFVLNDEVVTHGARARPVKSGDRVEVMPIFAGG